MLNKSIQPNALPENQSHLSMLFECHGNYRVYWKNNFLHVEPAGCFNLEGALRLNKVIETTVENNAPDQWIRLEIFNDINTFGPEEAHKALNNHFYHSKNHGCAAVCIVGGNILVRETIMNVCRRINLPVSIADSLQKGGKFPASARSISPFLQRSQIDPVDSPPTDPIGQHID